MNGVELGQLSVFRVQSLRKVGRLVGGESGSHHNSFKIHIYSMMNVSKDLTIKRNSSRH